MTYRGCAGGGGRSVRSVGGDEIAGEAAALRTGGGAEESSFRKDDIMSALVVSPLSA